MPERVAASGTVHWIGTGLSTGSGLRVLIDRGARVVLWGRTTDKARRCLAALGLSGRAAVAAFDLGSLEARLGRGDVVVSMLPAAEHAALVRLCLARHAHFACSSYVSDALRAERERAERAGIVVLTEAGLDPGIDHLLAHLLIRQGRAAISDVPAAADFTSYCGGVPAVANAFRYRFSWSPLGVLAALGAPARYIEDGAENVVARPWEATRPLVLDGEKFEAYPNRDSVPFAEQYGIPPHWTLRTFVRGTLRLDGWQDAWADVFNEVAAGDPARIGALAEDLAVRYPTTDADRDRVVLAVALTLRDEAGGKRWSGEYLLDMVGEDEESAMARCVSLPLACGITRILTGDTPPGLRRAADDADEAQLWLDFLRDQGVSYVFRSGENVG